MARFPLPGELTRISECKFHYVGMLSLDLSIFQKPEQ